MTTGSYEYPIGSGNYISQPPGAVESVSSGYRIGLAQNKAFDIPSGYDVWTTDGFVSIDSLLGKIAEVNEMRFVWDFTALKVYATEEALSTMQSRQYIVLRIDEITENTAKLALPNNPSTRVTPTFNYTCVGVLLNDPTSGIRYVVEVTVET